MCLINTEIQQVSNTKILVSPNSIKNRQLVIYSNYINNVSESNALILPVPLPHTIQFMDLSGYNDIFEDCAKCFYNPNKTKSFIYTNSFNTRREDSEPLKVFNVGSYKVSIAMNLEQINQIDKRVFELSDGLKQTLDMFYYQPYWGFIICKLTNGPESYHPIAYSHDIIDSKIYIPTRSYHKEVKWSDLNTWALGLPIDPKQNPINSSIWTDDNIDQSPMFKNEHFGRTSAEVNGWLGTNSIANLSDKNNNNNLKKLNDRQHSVSTNKNSSNIDDKYKNIADDWSHSIYMLNLNPNSNEYINNMNSCKEIWDKQSLFDPDKINWDFGPCYNFSKVTINGSHPNIDLIVQILA